MKNNIFKRTRAPSTQQMAMKAPSLEPYQPVRVEILGGIKRMIPKIRWTHFVTLTDFPELVDDYW